MKRFLASFVLIFALLSQSAFASFPDVESNFHQETAINWLQKNGVVNGYSDGTFKPENPVNRAEFLKMLYESMGTTNFDSSVKLPFGDVPAGEWYTKYVKQAYKDGVINGYPDGTFKPNNEINVVEALKIVDEAFLEVDLYYGDGSGFAYCPNGFLSFDQFLSEKNLDGSMIDQTAWYWKYMHVSGELCTFDFALNAWGMAGFLFDSYMDRGDMAELLYRTKAVHDEYAENGNYKKFVKGMKPLDLPPKKLTEETLGIKLEYPRVLAEPKVNLVDSSEDRPDLGTVILYDSASKVVWDAYTNANEGGPDYVSITVYKNSEKLSPKNWVVANKDAPYIYSNYDSESLDMGTLSVDGQSAIKYSWFGLGGADEVVFTNKSGDLMYVISAHYMSELAGVRDYLSSVVEGFSFL